MVSEGGHVGHIEALIRAISVDLMCLLRAADHVTSGSSQLCFYARGLDREWCTSGSYHPLNAIGLNRTSLVLWREQTR